MNGRFLTRTLKLNSREHLKGTTSNSRNNNDDRNAPIAANQHATISDTNNRPHRLMKTSSIAVEMRDQQLKAIPS